ncbi:MAG: ribosome small subunit-dependent GTPase A [Spirochaetota bacterium]|nr:ribosome small subunit-dependent GTPase A [Spirochaetota bacterium]
MNLEDLGYNETLEQLRIEHNLQHFEIGRIIAEHKERYVVNTAHGEYDAEITGKLRFTATGREDFPAVGDWVALTIVDSDFAIIHAILPRFSTIERQAVGKLGQKQIIAANVDFAFIVLAVDRDFNINRIERYLTICSASKVQPVIVLTRTDLINGKYTLEIIENIKQRIDNVPVCAISNKTQNGYKALVQIIEKGKTYCLLGSSGVGKSTLVNNLCGKDIMKTDTISQSTHKGRHVTSHRQLIILENGGILIDNPGMREVGIADASEGLETTFDDIYRLAAHCKFNDCTHTSEVGCAVIHAVEHGQISRESYENYLKMTKEKAFFESTVAERRQKDREFGKMLKNYKKARKQDKL